MAKNQNVEKKVKIERNAFLETVKAIIKASPDSSMTVSEALTYRNDLIMQMCSGVHESFVVNRSNKVVGNIYETACSLTLVILSEQLPYDNKLKIKDDFIEED